MEIGNQRYCDRACTKNEGEFGSKSESMMMGRRVLGEKQIFCRERACIGDDHQCGNGYEHAAREIGGKPEQGNLGEEHEQIESF